MRHNGRAPLLLSTLYSDCVTLDGDEIRSVVCADCGTWRVVRRGMVAAHRAEPRSNQPTDRPEQRKSQDWVPRCDGSGQRIKVDRRHREAMPAEIRRAAQQFYKPIPAPAAPVHRIVPPARSADSARQAYEIHRERCAGCTPRETCSTGRRLLATYTALLQDEPRRRQVRAAFARERARFDRQHAARAREANNAMWAKSALAPRGAAAKRAGTALEEANNVSKAVRPGALSEFRDPGLPLTPPTADHRPATSGPACARCGATETDLVRAAAAGWRLVRRRLYCGPCASGFPAWMSTQI
jgi:hypothetical protein